MYRKLLFVGILLIMLGIALLPAAPVAAQDDTGEDGPVITLPDQTFFEEQEDWAVGSLLAAGVIAAGLAITISTIKTIGLAPMRDGRLGDSVANLMDFGIWNGLTLYKLCVLVITFGVAYFAVVKQGYNPLMNSPYEGFQDYALIIQEFVAAGIVAFFAAVEHEGFTNWLSNRDNF